MKQVEYSDQAKPKNHVLKVRLTKEQRDRIEATARTKGYVALAPYVRNLLLGKEPSWEARLIEIDRNVRILLEGHR